MSMKTKLNRGFLFLLLTITLSLLFLSVVGHTIYTRFDSNCGCDSKECQIWKGSTYNADFQTLFMTDFSNIDKCKVLTKNSNTFRPATIYLDVSFMSLFMTALIAYRFRDLSLDEDEEED